MYLKILKTLWQFFLRSLGDNKGISSRRLTLFLITQIYAITIIYSLLKNVTIDKNILTSLELIICACLGVVSVSDFRRHNDKDKDMDKDKNDTKKRESALNETAP